MVCDLQYKGRSIGGSIRHIRDAVCLFLFPSSHSCEHDEHLEGMSSDLVQMSTWNRGLIFFRIWWSKVKRHCDHTKHFLAITQEFIW